MSESQPVPREEFPEIGELIVATVTKILDYGAYVKLDEYDELEGLLHRSEISSSRVRNIKNHIHEKEKVVLKVLRVDAPKRHIDLSLRRVTGNERKEKILEWKRSKRARLILEMAAERLKLEPKPFASDIMAKLEEKFDQAYAGIEELMDKGAELAGRLKLEKDWAEAIVEVAQQKIKLPRVTVKGVLRLTSTDPKGVDIIKQILTDSKALKKGKKIKVEIYTVGAPRYIVNVTARNYKDAEKTMEEIANYAVEQTTQRGGEGSFTREAEK